MVKRLEVGPLILGLSERGKAYLGLLNCSLRLAIQLTIGRNKMSSVSVVLGRRWTSEAHNNLNQLSPFGLDKGPGPSQTVLQDDLFKKRRSFMKGLIRAAPRIIMCHRSVLTIKTTCLFKTLSKSHELRLTSQCKCERETNHSFILRVH